MLRRLRASFPLKLLVAALLVFVVVGGYATLTAAETTDEVRSQQTNALETDAQQAAATTAVWLGTIESQAGTVAAAVESTDRSAPAVQRRTQAFNGSHDRPTGVVGIGYYNGTGYVGATNPAMTGTTPSIQNAPWLSTAADSQSFSEPYSVDWYENPVVAMQTPVDGGGTVITLLDLHEFTDALGANHDNIVIANEDRTIVASHNTSKIGMTHRSVGGTIPMLAGQDENATTMVMNDRNMVMAFAAVDGTGWTLMIHEDTGTAFATAQQVQSGLAGVLFIGLVGLVVIGATVGSSTVISLRQLSARAEQMAKGELDVSMETRRVDEFGTLYASLSTMRDNLKERIEAANEAKQGAEDARAEAEEARQAAEREREEAEAYTEQLQGTAAEYADAMQAAAAGDLTRRVDTDGRSDVMRDVGEEFNSMLGEIEETVQTLVGFAENVTDTTTDVEERADEVQTASEQVADAIDSIEAGARRQDGNLEDVARAIQDLSASAEEIAATTNNVAETSEQTAHAAEAGEEAATRAIEEMDAVVETTAEAAATIEALDDEMAEIGEIVDVIQDIAEETNMLALNASIEAARAGDGENGGQGFAVVADEVKSLSEETKESADEIEQRITGVQEQTGDAVGTVATARKRVQETAETVNDALTELETIANRVEENDAGIQEISGVTSDQANSAQDASAEIDEVAEISQQTVEEASNVSAAAQQQTSSVDKVQQRVADLSQQAESLQQLLAQFTVDDGSSVGGRETSGGRQTVSSDGGQTGGSR
jgi:methyl-accepting chemotaxis protein